jgi:hypothetical protein
MRAATSELVLTVVVEVVFEAVTAAGGGSTMSPVILLASASLTRSLNEIPFISEKIVEYGRNKEGKEKREIFN